MGEVVRVGLIGCGGMGRLRAAALRRTARAGSAGRVALTAVSDLDAGLAMQVAGTHGAVTARNWQALLQRPDVDAVIISTPPSSHAEIAIAALEAGKHVLCEKPLARTPVECAAMVDAAARHRRLLATGFNYRFYPAFKHARALLESGLIGELDHVRAYAGYSAAGQINTWLADADVVGGGALRDTGIHLIDLTRSFLGEVVEVSGQATHRVWNVDRCEDNGFVLMRNPDGSVAALQASWTEWRGFRFQVELYGTRGCITARCFPMLTSVYWADASGGRTRRRTNFFPMSNVMEHLRSYRWVVVESLVEELHAFGRAVAQGDLSVAPPLASGFDGLRAVEIAHEAATSPGQQPHMVSPESSTDTESGSARLVFAGS